MKIAYAVREGKLHEFCVIVNLQCPQFKYFINGKHLPQGLEEVNEKSMKNTAEKTAVLNDGSN
jgi:hypothetical protein